MPLLFTVAIFGLICLSSASDSFRTSLSKAAKSVCGYGSLELKPA
jgi:hypothetical protein